MLSRTKLALLTAAVVVPLILIVLSMSLVLAQDGGLDVRVIKSADRDSVTAGEPLTYTIVVSNGSSVTATNIVVTDTLPPGVEYVDSTDSCVDIAGVLSCTIPYTLPPGYLAAFMMEVDVAPDAYNPDDPQICNNAWVSATTELGEGDTDLSDNHREECIPLYEEADLAIDKESLSGDVVPIGEWFTYRLRAENLGPSNSRVPVVMDWFATDGSLSMVAGQNGACGPMPTDQGWAETPAWLLNWVDAVCDLTGDPYFCDAIEPWWEAWWAYWYNSFPPNYPYPLAVDWMCIWYTDGLEPGEPFPLTVDVLPLDAQTIYNQAWVVPDMYPYNWFEEWYDGDGWGTPDPDPYNNMEDLVTQVTEEADLSVIKFSKPDVQVDAGQPFTYTIYVENLGPAPAQKVSIRDETLSSGSFEVLGVILDPNRADDGPFYMPSPQGGETMEFNLNEPLEPKGTENQGRWVIQIVLQADETQDVNNLVQVFTREGGSFDPDLSNNQDEDSIYVGDVADLIIEKYWQTTAPDDCYLYDESEHLYGVRAGCPLRFVVGVGNIDGPSQAENVVMEDFLPAGVTVEGVWSSHGSCTTGIPGDPSAPLTCNLGNIPPGDVGGAEIHIDVRTDADLAKEALENDALVYSDIFDPDNGNNRAHVLIWVEPFSYLNLVKHGPDPAEIRAGEEIHYWIDLRNDGPSTAHDVHLDDQLPEGVSLLDAQVMIGDGSCAPNSALCSLGDLGLGEWNTVRVRGYVEPWVEGVITNTANASAASPWDFSAITNTVTTTVRSQADLSIWKSADPYTVYAGEEMRYDVSVTNNGPAAAKNVVVSDTLPSEVEYEVATIGCSYPPGGPLTCPLGDIPPGETRNFSIFVRVNPDAIPGMITNEVAVSSTNESENTMGNNSYTEASLVLGKADLRVLKYGKPDGVVEAGDELVYTVIVDNLGPGYAHEVVLYDLFRSSGWAYHFDDWRSDLDAECLHDRSGRETTITCELDDPLEPMSPGSSGRWVLKFYFEFYEEQSVNNVAQVVGSDEDPDLSNNLAIVEHEVTAVADLDLEKEASGDVLVGCDGYTQEWEDEVAAGGELEYTLHIENEGPSEAENVVVEDWGLSPFLDIVDVECEKEEDGECSCNLSGLGELGDTNRHLVCYLGTIEEDDEDDVTITARIPSDVPEGTRLVNDARVYSDVFDDHNGDNLASNWTYVIATADLGVEKSQEPVVALPGQDITYSITVTNDGPSDAQGVIISDTIPVEVLNPTWTCCCSSDGGECDVPCEVPVCPPGECPWPDIGLYAQADIPADGYAIYTIEGVLDVWPCGVPFTNTVEILPPLSLVHPEVDIDPCDENNDDYVENIVPFCNYDPLVLKSYPGPDSPP